MKRIVLLVLTLVSLLCCTACSCNSCKSTPPSPEGAYFLRDYKQTGVVAVNEVAEYSVKFKEKTISNKKDVIIPDAQGTFTTILTNDTLGSKLCYKYSTVYSLKGTYTYNGVVKEVNDEITSSVWFLGKGTSKKNRFKPLKTTKTIKCLTPYVEKQNNFSSIKFINYDFSYEIDYSSENAKITYTDNSADKNLKEKDKTINKFYSSSFCDNDFLTFYPRLFKLSSTFSTTRNTITASGATALSMKVNAYNKDFKVKFNNKEQTIKVDTVSYSLTGDYAGAPLNVYLANVKDKNSLFRLPVKIEKTITLVGEQEYDIVSFEHNEG